MGKKGARLVALIVGVVYPFLTALVVYAVIHKDETFKKAVLEGGLVKKMFASETKAANPNGLTDFQMVNGIGPIQAKQPIGSEIDVALANQGEALFKIKCSACHKLDQRYVGPPLRGVVSFRTPEYIMNMILNPQEMVQKHPVARGLLAQYMTVMSPQNVQASDARAILEFLRYDFEKNMK